MNVIENVRLAKPDLVDDEEPKIVTVLVKTERISFCGIPLALETKPTKNAHQRDLWNGVDA
jgi:hypothetical protein